MNSSEWDATFEGEEEDPERDADEEENRSFVQSELHFQKEFKRLESQFDCRNFSMKDYVNHIYEKREIQSSTLYSVDFISSEDSRSESEDVQMLSENPSQNECMDRSSDSNLLNSSKPELPSFVYSASSNGRILVYEFENLINNSSLLLTPQAQKNPPKISPTLTVEAHEGIVFDTKFSYLKSQPYLFSCGEDGKILGWKWKDFLLDKNEDEISGTEFSVFPAFGFTNVQKRGLRNSLKEMSSTNCLAVDKLNNIVYGGTDDGCINGYDLESEKCCLSLCDELDSIKYLSYLKAKSLIVSGSRNGFLKLWDSRMRGSILTLDPLNPSSDQNEMNRKTKAKSFIKKPISCLDVDEEENWMVCGSMGKTLTLFSVRDFSPALKIHTNFFPHAIKICNDEVIAGGSEPLISKWNINGKSISKNVCFTESIYSIATHPFGLMVVGGYGGILDILTNYGSHLCTFRSY